MTPKPLAFITGAAGGIGRAVTAHFHSAGYQLWLSDHNAEGVAELAQLYPDAITDTTDLTDPAALETLCQVVESSEAEIAVGFVNAGVIKPGPATALERSEIDTHIAVNLTAAAHLSQALAKRMEHVGKGHIIGTVSAAGMIALPESAAYTASKFGFRGYLLSLAQEVRKNGVYISCIYPNAIDTPMLRYEALNGGSVLNFLSAPLSTEDIVAAVKRALKGKRLEYYVPRVDYVVTRFATCFPGLMRPLLPMLNRLGETGRKKFLKKIEAAEPKSLN